MSAHAHQSTWLREELLHLLSLSGTLAGFCITAVTLFHTMLDKSSVSETIADETLAFSASLFLICIYTIFFALRTKHQALAMILEKIADAMFLIALTGLVGAACIMVLTIW